MNEYSEINFVMKTKTNDYNMIQGLTTIFFLQNMVNIIEKGGGVLIVKEPRLKKSNIKGLRYLAGKSRQYGHTFKMLIDNKHSAH